MYLLVTSSSSGRFLEVLGKIVQVYGARCKEKAQDCSGHWHFPRMVMFCVNLKEEAAVRSMPVQVAIP